MRKNLLTGVSITSPEPDGASAVAFKFNTAVAYVSAGANLFEFSNNGTPKVYASKDGSITAGGLSVDNISGWEPDSATAVGIILRSGNTYSTDGANLLRLRNNSTNVMDFSFQGGIDHANSGASTAAHSQSLNLNWAATTTQTSSGQYSAVIGDNNRASGNNAIAMGQWSVASGNNAIALGNTNVVEAVSGFAIGEKAKIISGQNVTLALGGSSFAAAGDAQSMMATLKAATTNATQTTMQASTSSAYVIPADTTWAFSALVVARSDEADGNVSRVWEFKGLLTRDESNVTNIYVGHKMDVAQTSTDAGPWLCDIYADDTNEALAIKVTGQAATNIRWVCKLDIVQVGYA